MKTVISGGRLIDPASGVDEVCDLYLDGEAIVAPEQFSVSEADQTIDVTGCVVMAGGIDIHTHIGGGKLAIARMLMQDQGGSVDPAHSAFLPTAAIAASRYLEMGYTVAFEPAVIACNARSAHAEMADMPGLATGGFCVLGNDELLLQLIADDCDQALINDYVAWMVRATQCIAVKVVNPGGISAFKFGKRSFDVDTPHPRYGVTAGTIIRRLARAVYEIGLAHPLHVHASQLGVPGNIRTTLATIRAAQGYPIHLTHAQFHCYGDQSEHGMSSGAAELADALNQHPNVTIDVGQIMFGQTVTISADAPHQFENRKHASPRKSIIADVECEAGCGVVPFRYRRKQFVNALQWAIGLELFLMIDDPRRVFLTTDHPNGAPFTAYPHLIRLLGDRSFRETALAELHPDAAAASSLGGMSREYSLQDIAAMTRSGPAQIMGLAGRGKLAAGCVADVAVYQSRPDLEAMFRAPVHVFAGGQHVIDRSRLADPIKAACDRKAPDHRLLCANVEFQPSSVKTLRQRYNDTSTFDFNRLWISDDEMQSLIGATPVPQRCRRPGEINHVDTAASGEDL